MKIDDMTLRDVEERLAALDTEVRSFTEAEQVEAATEEKKQLLERKAELVDLEQRKKTAMELNEDKIAPKVIEQRKVEKPMSETVFTAASPEYRSAYLKNLRKMELTDIEQRAFTTLDTSAGAAIPEITLNRIVEEVRQHAPLLGEINLLQVPGGVKVPVEDVVNAATKHAENAAITVSVDTLKSVELFGYEIVKLLQVSKSVAKMSIEAFEGWLVRNLAKSLAAKITDLIINGTGTGEATGLESITWDATNSVTVAAGDDTTAQDVADLIGLLPGGYDAGAKFLMSKRTLFSQLKLLQSNEKYDLVVNEGRNYYLTGYPVMLDERIPLGEAYLGNFSEGYYANMPEQANVVSAFDIDTNSYKFLGSAIFDGKVVLPGAFVKLVKGA